VVLLVVVIAPIVGYFTVPAVRSQIDALIEDASIAITLWRNPPDNALDADVGTLWLGDPTAGAPTLTVNFGETTDLAGMIFQAGAAPGDDYLTHARPRQIELSFPGDERTEVIELADDPGPQERCLSQNRSVRTLDIRIVGVYEAEAAGDDLVAIRDIEFISVSCP